jgi:hypothetical protein
MDNPETLAILGTQDTGRRKTKQIKVRENRRGDHEWTMSIILACVFTIIPLEFRTVLTVWYRMFFITFVYLCIFALIKAIKYISYHIIG